MNKEVRSWHHRSDEESSATTNHKHRCTARTRGHAHARSTPAQRGKSRTLAKEALEAGAAEDVPGDGVGDGGEDPVEFADDGPPVSQPSRNLLMCKRKRG